MTDDDDPLLRDIAALVADPEPARHCAVSPAVAASEALAAGLTAAEEYDRAVWAACDANAPPPGGTFAQAWAGVRAELADQLRVPVLALPDLEPEALAVLRQRYASEPYPRRVLWAGLRALAHAPGMPRRGRLV